MAEPLEPLQRGFEQRELPALDPVCFPQISADAFQRAALLFLGFVIGHLLGLLLLFGRGLSQCIGCFAVQERRQAASDRMPQIIRRAVLQQVQHGRRRGEVRRAQRLRRPFGDLGDHARVRVRAGRDHAKPHRVLAAAPGSAGHLLKFGRAQHLKALRAALAVRGHDDGARRKVHAGRDRAGRDHQPQHAAAHQLLEQEPPH